jgi:uncharacterized glyoxalase superfamily protein PhnB
MATNDDIFFLETFRSAIVRFLVVGAAPTHDPLWGGTGLIDMQKAMKIEEFQALRRDINQQKGRAAKILIRLGVTCTFNQYPPPAVGGPVVKYPLFDLITDNRSHHSIDGSVFTDKLDEAIGLLRHESEVGGDGEAILLGASPCLPVLNLDVALAFYADCLGFRTLAAAPSTNENYCFIGRGDAHLMLQRIDKDVNERPVSSQAPREGAWDAMIQTSDPDALLVAFRESGVTTLSALTDDCFGWRGFSLTDPDGNRLFFGVTGNTPLQSDS